MAVRHFDYAEAKATMAKVQDEANKVKTYLSKCDSIINENVGVENRWSGQRATDFKQKWEKAAANFENFVQLINNYANKIDESYRVHQQFDQTQN
mgnify:FL=1